jgi:methylenetetrahydrofolate dehydrogenase (NADP+) / methenyltetrahydrofolate cyclohydrolase
VTTGSSAAAPSSGAPRPRSRERSARSERNRRRREPAGGRAPRGGGAGPGRAGRRRDHAGPRHVLVGEDYAAQAYERRVRRQAEELGCRYVGEQLPAEVEEADALALVGKLNADPRITGILILRPLPNQVREEHLYEQLDPLKDVEAVHPENAGLLALGEPRYTPSTPASIFWLLDCYVGESGRDPATFYNGLDLVLVGRSNNVGKPALDVGINPVTDEETGKVRLVGDLDFETVAEKAEAITPVPGGIGPITDVWLLRNTVEAARLRGPRGR